ncbi:hypothetical protein ABT168_32595 [Streptomyces sp. NPDC001793]|uniref:hypothetical protein n=1 Tax=Streptomyces sp. NPDC001793 TaxID=3154657 RepID=UPI003329920A
MLKPDAPPRFVRGYSKINARADGGGTRGNVAVAGMVECVLRTIVFTPALRVPHCNDGIVNSDGSFGFVFRWWDRMFGTYNTARRSPQWRIGLGYSHDLSLRRLIVQSFVPKQFKGSAIAPAPYVT